MFQLVIVIIGLAILAALSVASIYFLGPTFSKQSLKAQAVRVINGASQISGGINLYQEDHGGSMPTSLASLVSSHYLSAIPSGNWAYGAHSVQATQGDKIQLCEEINRIYNGSPSIYWIDDPDAPHNGCFAQVCTKAQVQPAGGCP